MSMSQAPSSRPSKTDLMYEIIYNPKFVPVTSPRVSVQLTVEGRETRNLMRINPLNYYDATRFYELDESSNIIWKLIDGTKSVEQIAAEAQATGKISDPDSITQSLLFFAESNALVSEQDPLTKKRVRVVSSFITEVTLIWDATRIFRFIHRIIHPLLQRFMFWISMGVVALGLVVFAPRFGPIFGNPDNFRILGSTVVGFLFYNFIILGPVIIIHESSHGLALYHYSKQAGEVGTGFFYFGPMFYVDATSYWSLPRRQRIMLMWAGNLSTLLIGSILVLSTLLVNYPADVSRVVNVASFWCFYVTLWNLAPPFETDGYHILADIVSIPNLRADGLGYLKSRVLRLLGRPVDLEQASSPKSRILLGYAIFSLSLLAFIGFQTVRFSSYMAVDAASWFLRIGSSLVAVHLSPAAYVVGLTTIVYFALSLGGYGVLVLNQVRKSRVRGLQFEPVHDRHLSVFLYLPEGVPSVTVNGLEKKIRQIAQKITPNVSVGRNGRLIHTTLRIGGTTLPLSQIKTYLRKIEEDFNRLYEKVVVRSTEAIISRFLAPASAGVPLNQLLKDMTGKASPEEKREARATLKEFLRRQKENTQYLIHSTFATVWTIELPPAQQYELLQNLLPRLLIEDLMMTNLLDEEEEFKRRVVYGLDSIAQLTQESSSVRDKALQHPEKYQLVAFFEPVKSRLTFIGRTERMEKDIEKLGPLFTIHAWSGYLDNLLGDASLNLHAVKNSFIPVPDDLSGLKDGEVKTLNRYFSTIRKTEDKVLNSLEASRQTVKQVKAWLRDLKVLFEPSRDFRIGQLDSVLALNSENLSSIPYGVVEVADLTKQCFNWTENYGEMLTSEETKRQEAYLARRKKSLAPYGISTGLTGAMVSLALLQPQTLFLPTALEAFGIVQAFWVSVFYLLHRSSEKPPRYPSGIFTQTLSSVYAFTQILSNLVVGTGALNTSEIIGETSTRIDNKKEEVPQASTKA